MKIARRIHRIVLLGVIAVPLLALGGCFYIGQHQYESIIRIPPERWSSRDELTIVLGGMVHNLTDEKRQVDVVVTPFYPSVILALNRMRMSQQHWTDDEACYHLDELMHAAAGMYVDWQDGRLVLEAWADAAHLEGLDVVGG